jgi:hypothetical protein
VSSIFENEFFIVQARARELLPRSDPHDARTDVRLSRLAGARLERQSLSANHKESSMNTSRNFAYAIAAVLFTLAASAALGLSRARPDQFPNVKLFGGAISSYAKLDAKGSVLEAGVVVPMGVIERAPKKMDMDAPIKADAVLEFPEVVRKITFLNHLGLFWNPMGHPPMERYGVPHWDFHFFTIQPKEAAAIDCKNLAQGDPKAVAQGWLPSVPPNAPAKDFCVPLMGFHSAPVTEFKAPGQLKDGAFDKVMLGGYYAGQYVFVEPMVAQTLLQKRQSFSLPVPVPSSLGSKTLYPTRFDAIFDVGSQAYRFVFSAFRPID